MKRAYGEKALGTYFRCGKRIDVMWLQGRKVTTGEQPVKSTLVSGTGLYFLGATGYTAGCWGVFTLTFPFGRPFQTQGFHFWKRDGTEGGAGSAPAKPSLTTVMWKIPLLEGQVWIMQSKQRQGKKTSLPPWFLYLPFFDASMNSWITNVRFTKLPSFFTPSYILKANDFRKLFLWSFVTLCSLGINS